MHQISILRTGRALHCWQGTHKYLPTLSPSPFQTTTCLSSTRTSCGLILVRATSNVYTLGVCRRSGQVNLPEDDPIAIKHLVQNLYEREYDPKLPDGEKMDIKKIVFDGYKEGGYAYDFSRSCGAKCPARREVCPHHYCGSQCLHNCVEFVCKECCPHATRVKLPPPAGHATQLQLHAQMYELGDKYEVLGLKDLVRGKFLRSCAKYWNNDLFAPAAHYAFSTTPEDDLGLRKAISSVISQHMTILNKPAVEALLAEFNGLALGFLKSRAEELG